MSGHSKWSTIKRKKGATDAKRGKLFSKVIKEITVAARAGGGDIDTNPRLRTIVDTAKTANMPSDNIARAIKRGTGELEGITYEETTFEGYGPGGVALMLEVVTDNRNRTVADIRHILSKHNGNLGESGCVAWMFKKRGVLTFDRAATTEEQLMEVCLEAGAEDIVEGHGLFEVFMQPTLFHTVQEACRAANVSFVAADMRMDPQNTVKLESSDAERMLKLMELLEDHDDIQNVYANFDIDDQLLEQLTN